MKARVSLGNMLTMLMKGHAFAQVEIFILRFKAVSFAISRWIIVLYDKTGWSTLC